MGGVAAADQDEVHQEARGSSVAVIEGMDIHQAHVCGKGFVRCVAGGHQPAGEIVHSCGDLRRGWKCVTSGFGADVTGKSRVLACDFRGGPLHNHAMTSVVSTALSVLPSIAFEVYVSSMS